MCGGMCAEGHMIINKIPCCDCGCKMSFSFWFQLSLSFSMCTSSLSFGIISGLLAYDREQVVVVFVAVCISH